MNANKMMGKTALALAVALMLGVAAYAHEGHTHGKEKAKKKTDIVTVRGEVLDLSCYLGHGAKGKKHQKCAKSCLVEKHVPAGLLTKDGDVYLLVEDHKHEKAFRPVARLAAEYVQVTGKKVKKGGLPAIMVHKIKKIKK